MAHDDWRMQCSAVLPRICASIRRSRDLVSDLFIAIFYAGIPVGAASYLLAWWAMKQRYFGDITDIKAYEKEVKRLSDAKSGKKGGSKGRKNTEALPALNPVHQKWVSFGGGFYGVVALLTYVVVELAEVRDFVANLGGLLQILSNISIALLIDFLFDSLMNFFMAIAWPYYWIVEYNPGNVWIWFLVAYGGYLGGTRLALHQASQART